MTVTTALATFRPDGKVTSGLRSCLPPIHAALQSDRSRRPVTNVAAAHPPLPRPTDDALHTFQWYTEAEASAGPP